MPEIFEQYRGVIVPVIIIAVIVIYMFAAGYRK